jgi:protein O-GlcNAc transferase
MVAIPEAMTLAWEHHVAGRLDRAERIYRQILQVECDSADTAPRSQADYVTALNNLGNVLKDKGQLAEAAQCYEHVLQIKPDCAQANYNLGNVQLAIDRPDKAIAFYQRALQLQPDFFEAQANLGHVLKEQGHLPEAALCYRRALQIKPNHARTHYNLGNIQLAQGYLASAADSYRQALQLQPDFVDALSNLGSALAAAGEFAEAGICCQRALRIKPDHAKAHYNLGYTQEALARLDEAAASYQRALQEEPDFVDAHTHLGNVWKDKGQLADAAGCYQQSLQINPNDALAHNNLGVVLKEQGQITDALACFRRAMQLQPDYAEAHSNWLYTLAFCPEYDARMICAEHHRWNRRHAEPLAKFIQPHANDPAPERRLRIGYVSPDLREHPVGRFLLPLLEAHDHESLEIICYAGVCTPDAVTACCRAHADGWRDVRFLSDENAARLIRQDRIDVLVDLTMHMANNRLLVFARKPAPVQVTYLAYCGTTGLSTMDYRLTDPYLDPRGPDETPYVEKSIWLPETYWCYRPAIPNLGVTPLPAVDTGRITFGCLNNFCKVSAPALAAWSRLLQAVPEARLLLHSYPGNHRDRLRDFLAQQGIAPERLMFVGMVPAADYYRLYERIDVVLDPFPYGGGTTTCDALWMGVPVVSLAGQTAVGRGGLSLLSNIGLGDLVAHDVEQYIRIAVELAGDLPRLRALRAGLRERLQRSPVMDAPRFARNIETAYREMWHRWCGRPVSPVVERAFS